MAQQTSPTAARIRTLGAQAEESIVAARRHLHAHPELSGAEHATSAFVRARLDEFGIPYHLVEGPLPRPAFDGRTQHFGTGVVATVRGTAPGAYLPDGRPARRVALRCDMDALPIDEEADVPFRSQAPGVMHACGHDCHTAMMLGTVGLLAQMRDALRGEVRVIFQPAEEISSGARDLVAAGVLDGVDAIYGAHVWSEVDAGTVSCEAGPRMANTDWFRIDIRGVSAHGSMPHKGIDAIVVAAEIINELQVIVSRRTSPFEPVVITVGEVHGGSARNIMAGSAYLTGTVRTWNAGMRERIADRMERIAGKTAHAFGAQISFSFERGNPAVVNDAACAQAAQQAVRDVLGDAAVGSYQGTLAGEDFAEYLQKVPGVFAFIGTRNPAIGADAPQHSPRYLVDESVLAGGAAVAAEWACAMLR